MPEELHDELVSEATQIIQSYGYVASQAHLAIEAKPPVHWNKGEAALLILKEEFGNDWTSHVKAVFAGDDTTDEDAMNVSDVEFNFFFFELILVYCWTGTEGQRNDIQSISVANNKNVCRLSCPIDENGVTFTGMVGGTIVKFYGIFFVLLFRRNLFN